MKKYIKIVTEHPLISGTSVVFIGSLISNVFNFLFNLFMSRNLSLVDYGILGSLVSVMALATLPASSFTTTMVQFAASYIADHDEEKLHGLFRETGKLLLYLALGIFIVLTISMPVISTFFHIQNRSLIFFTILLIAISYLSTLSISFLQAKLSFLYLSLSSILGALAKFSFGVIFVLLGYSLSGSMWAIFIGFMIYFILSYIPFYPFLIARQEVRHIQIRDIIRIGMPTTIVLLFLTSLSTIDVILVKHFFSADNAGLYAGISLIGKVIFYFTAPISVVMFPLIVRKSKKNEPYRNTFLLSLLLVTLPSLLITVVYFLYPDFIIQIFLKKSEYLRVKDILWIYGSFIMLFSILNVVVNVYLSLKKTYIIYPLLLAALLQVILISFFHSSLITVIIISLGVTAAALLFLVCNMLFYEKNRGN